MAGNMEGLSKRECRVIADNEIRYRGIYGNAVELKAAYARTYPEMTEEDARYIRDLINGATITLPEINRVWE